jgi:hypothetical protein
MRLDFDLGLVVNTPNVYNISSVTVHQYLQYFSSFHPTSFTQAFA